MVAELRNENGILFDFVNQTMLLINSPGPIARQGIFEGFGFSFPFVWSSADFVDKSIYSF